MSKWINVKLGEVGTIVGGSTPSTKNKTYWNGPIPWLTPKDLANFYGRYISAGERNITEEGLKNCSTQLVPKHTILFTSRAPIGYIAIADKELCTNQGFKSIIPNERINYLFLYYLLKYYKDYLESFASGTTFFELSASVMKEIQVNIPSEIEIQRKIASILDKIDAKIEINIQINDNLERQVFELFNSKFSPFLGNKDSTIPMGEYFDISIGKTPPRKETQWFSRNSEKMKWISISDMGKNEVFISDSTEFLIPEAINKFNIVNVPDNTVIMSFKLTIGRVLITDGQLTTNEAIAHFKCKNKNINEYLYCYLKSFNFQNLGSTSSIATAINSKIIKKMPFILPDNNLINEFHNLTFPLFQKIKTNLRENKKLKNIRDSLLPKLMSGELDVSDIDI